MNKRWMALAALAFSLVGAVSTASADFEPVKLDTVHTRLGFTASTLLFDVDGHFNKYELKVDGDPHELAKAKVALTIETASIDTDNAKRDEHLSSADFFDVKKFPQITFVSESLKQNGNTLTVTGTLTMHGVKRKVSIPFKKAQGKNGAGVDTTAFKGKLTVKRSDYGIGTDSVAAKISLEDEVTLELSIVAFL